MLVPMNELLQESPLLASRHEAPCLVKWGQKYLAPCFYASVVLRITGVVCLIIGVARSHPVSRRDYIFRDHVAIIGWSILALNVTSVGWLSEVNEIVKKRVILSAEKVAKCFFLSLAYTALAVITPAIGIVLYSVL